MSEIINGVEGSFIKQNALGLGRVLKKRENTMFFVLIGMFIVSGIISPTFRSIENIFNIFNHNAVYGTIALGMSFVLITGAIDLSVSSTAALTAIVSTHLFREFGFVIGVAGGLSVGCIMGLVNGLLITKAKINYFVTTLGTMTIGRGIIYIVTNGFPVMGVPRAYGVIGLGKIGPFPISASIWIVLAVVLFFVLRYTTFGQYLYAIGGNENASWLSGVKTQKLRILAFMYCGMLASLGGVLLNLRVLMATADACQGYELTAIAGCIVGGISLEGGRGNILGSVIGTIILGLILNLIQLLGVNPFWQSAITGMIILGAVGIDSLSNTKRD